MKSLQMKGGLMFMVFAIAATLVIASNKSASAQSTQKDTLPKKTEKKIRNIDEALSEIDKAHEEMERSLKEIDWKKMETELVESMKKMEIDLSKMKVEIDKSMKEFDASKIKAEIDASMAKIDWDKIQKDIDKVRTIDFEKLKVDLEKAKPDIEKSMKDAQESIEKAKAGLKEYKTFLNGLEKEGLIDENGSYTIEHKNGQLIINGKIQPADVYNRYRTFLEKHQELTIKKSADNFEIEKD